MYFVYIIQSELDSSFYIGYSRDVTRRLEKHNTATKGYTARKKPWIVRYTEELNTKTEALKRERFLKRQKSKSFIQSLISQANPT